MSGTTTTVTEHLTGATFTDGSTLSGDWTATYDSAGNLLSIGAVANPGGTGNLPEFTFFFNDWVIT